MIIRKDSDCCCEWKQMIQELWSKFQSVIQGIRFNGHTFYPNGEGVIDLQYWYQKGTTSITPDKWNENQQATIDIDNLTSEDDVIIGPTPASLIDWGDNRIFAVSQSANQIVFECQTVPLTTINVQWVIL